MGFRDLHPAIGIHLHEQSLAVMLPMLRSDELDLCFGLTVPGDHGDDLTGRKLFDEPLLAALSPGHPLAGRRSIRLEELAAGPLIRFRTGSSLQTAIDAEFDRVGATASWAFESFELETVRALASRGIGVALMPEGYLDRRGLPHRRRAAAPAGEAPGQHPLAGRAQAAARGAGLPRLRARAAGGRTGQARVVIAIRKWIGSSAGVSPSRTSSSARATIASRSESSIAATQLIDSR